MQRPLNIVLVGFMGTGKTAVGREVARALGWRVADTDALIEAKAGCTVGEIFDRQGEGAFRDLETKILQELAGSAEGTVISAGGGAVLRGENWEAFKKLGPVVALSASVDAILERTGRGTTRRPLLEVENPRGEIERRLSDRAPHYAKAAHQIQTDGKTPKEVAREILEVLGLAK